ncbi:MAG: hypothetical protein LBU70_00635 [Chitinispirillales bacterium]|nr:hypothetical protein [Chitinispirillales bacterium]
MSNKPVKSVSFEDIRATLAEVAQFQKETAQSQKETDRLVKELVQFQKELAQSQKETDEQMKKTDEGLDKLRKQVGGIDDNISHHAEQFFQDALNETLTFGGEKYDFMTPNITRQKGGSGVEFDILLENGKSVAVIEVKNRIHPNFVTELAEKRLAKFRELFPLYKNHKVYLGIAGFSFSKAVLERAQKYGIGVIRQVGKTIEIETEHLKAY